VHSPLKICLLVFTRVHGIESEKLRHVVIMKSFFLLPAKTNDLSNGFDIDFPESSVWPKYLFSSISWGLTPENPKIKFRN